MVPCYSCTRGLRIVQLQQVIRLRQGRVRKRGNAWHDHQQSKPPQGLRGSKGTSSRRGSSQAQILTIRYVKRHVGRLFVVRFRPLPFRKYKKFNRQAIIPQHAVD